MTLATVETPQPSIKDLINLADIEQRVRQRLEAYKQLPVVMEARKIIQEAQLREKGYTYHFGQQPDFEDHTEDVMYSALYIAECNNELVRRLHQNENTQIAFLPGEPQDILGEEEMEDLAIAAVYHETGFAQIDAQAGRQANGKGHEVPGAENGRQGMARAGYSAERVDRVAQAILDTAVCFDGGSIQVATLGNPISQPLLDADVFNFGRKDFEEKSKQVCQETNGDPVKSNAFALNFLLKRHHWQTTAARLLGQATEKANMAALEDKVKAAS